VSYSEKGRLGNIIILQSEAETYVYRIFSQWNTSQGDGGYPGKEELAAGVVSSSETADGLSRPTYAIVKMAGVLHKV